MTNPTCKDCPDWHPICHDSCPKYAEYKRQLKEQRAYTKTRNTRNAKRPRGPRKSQKQNCARHSESNGRAMGVNKCKSNH